VLGYSVSSPGNDVSVRYIERESLEQNASVKEASYVLGKSSVGVRRSRYSFDPGRARKVSLTVGKTW
jgi:hypothetical protein